MRCREGAQKESLSHDSFLRDLGHKRGGLGWIFGRVKNDNSTSKSGQNYIYWFEPVNKPVANHAFSLSLVSMLVQKQGHLFLVVCHWFVYWFKPVNVVLTTFTG